MNAEDLIKAIECFNKEPEPMTIEELKHLKKLEKQNKIDRYGKELLRQGFYKITIDEKGWLDEEEKH